MHKQLHPTDAEIAAARFDEYTGPAGPREAQIHQNNLALMSWAIKTKIPCKLIMTDFDGAMDEPVECVDFGRFTVGYDRWGFVFDGEGDFEDCDQAGFAEACAKITEEMSS